MRECLASMDDNSRKVFCYMSAFLVKGIVANKEINKMNAYNLAVVFGPCFFRPYAYSLQALMSSVKFSSIVLLTLENFETLLGSDEANLYFEMLDTKNTLAKCAWVSGNWYICLYIISLKVGSPWNQELACSKLLLLALFWLAHLL